MAFIHLIYLFLYSGPLKEFFRVVFGFQEGCTIGYRA